MQIYMAWSSSILAESGWETGVGAPVVTRRQRLQFWISLHILYLFR